MKGAEGGRFVTKKQYGEMHGLSYATVNHMIKSGQLPYITTESGLERIDTQGGDKNTEAASMAEIASLKATLDQQSKMLSALCQKLNTKL